jgi:hypothetical protein
VRRLSYRTLGVTNDLQPQLDAMRLVLGSPQGSGQLVFGGQTTPLPLRPVINDKGLTLHLSDFRSKSAKASFNVAGDGAAVMELAIAFESEGDELRGALLSEIDVFRCGSFQIEASRCSPVTAACIRSVLGEATGSAPACTQPAAWGPQRIRGPERPVRGNIDDATLTVWIKFAPNANGTSAGALDRAEFRARIGLEASGAALPLSSDEVQSRLRREIERRLFDDLAARDAWQRIANMVHAGLTVNVRNALVRGYYPLRGGSGLFADLETR